MPAPMKIPYLVLFGYNATKLILAISDAFCPKLEKPPLNQSLKQTLKQTLS
jgi:hypothetical protein